MCYFFSFFLHLLFCEYLQLLELVERFNLNPSLTTWIFNVLVVAVIKGRIYVTPCDIYMNTSLSQQGCIKSNKFLFLKSSSSTEEWTERNKFFVLLESLRKSNWKCNLSNLDTTDCISSLLSSFQNSWEKELERQNGFGLLSAKKNN